jgi:hypothetical protein
VLEDRGQLAHAQGAMFERDSLIGAECLGSDGDLLARRFRSEWIEAAQELAVSGIDRFDGHVWVKSTLMLA